MGKNARIFNVHLNTVAYCKKIAPVKKMEKYMSPARHHNQSPMTKVLNSLSSDPGIVIIAAVVLLAVYLVDTITPLGEPVWLLYFIPLVLSYWSERIYAIPTVCIVTILFLVGGFLVSPQGIAVSQAILLRFTFFLVFISASIILWTFRRRQLL
ncbi:MAG: hypothetical protein Q8S57_09910 [Methanoregula sp.]|nr:hypothetical protein [Methanoregula sp.]